MTEESFVGKMPHVFIGADGFLYTSKHSKVDGPKNMKSGIFKHRIDPKKFGFKNVFIVKAGKSNGSSIRLFDVQGSDGVSRPRHVFVHPDFDGARVQLKLVPYVFKAGDDEYAQRLSSIIDEVKNLENAIYDAWKFDEDRALMCGEALKQACLKLNDAVKVIRMVNDFEKKGAYE